jgi:hypothetical protein
MSGAIPLLHLYLHGMDRKNFTFKTPTRLIQQVKFHSISFFPLENICLFPPRDRKLKLSTTTPVFNALVRAKAVPALNY